MSKEAMKPEQLISNIKVEIESLISLYGQGSEGQTDLGIKLDSLELSSEIKEQVVGLIKQAIEESTYNLLCGLEGSASIAGTQECYEIKDESGNILSGELDSLFYEQIME
ncbi:hypothetical protein TUM4438_45800 [Shewanella sairae]|uniref:Uncharacterized protein n=1 Tax=Shewanella sairae TaxID=190310 RepID=A0ABQ4PS47_9GAMM|nr:hypothetical protein [Shewanella sairae]MCL1132627.1 hypothetical protein [Shewanella sairae]GIU52631.1 hypothetical protein TUM4438_45800 [Shewanella sairae]